VLRKGSDIPPLMFTADELESLVVGTRFVRAFAGARLAQHAKAALIKIEAVLPEDLRERAGRTRIFAPVWRSPEQIEGAALIDRLNAAIAESHVLHLEYCDESGRVSAREVEPICLAFWGGKWTLGTWCRLRVSFRNFRPDRIARCTATGETFDQVPERSLTAYLQSMRGLYDGMG
jgi:predicted DNA-binding transcriptional regulator YafY